VINTQLTAAVAGGAKDYIQTNSVGVCHANILSGGESLKHWYIYCHIVTGINLTADAT